jgi:hypothetical protein
MVTLDIKYEEMFEPTPETPIRVVIPDEKFIELSKKYGIYNFDWYFVDANMIKYFDGKKWNYEHITPDKIITQKESEERLKQKLKEVV